MAPFDRSYTTYYWSAIVSMALSCIISDIKWDIGWILVENRDIFIPPLHLTLPFGGSPSDIAMPFGKVKLEWCGYPMIKKFDDVFSRFYKIPACDTDGHTNGQTDRHLATATVCTASRGTNIPTVRTQKNRSYCPDSSRYEKISDSGTSLDSNCNLEYGLCKFYFTNRVDNT